MQTSESSTAARPSLIQVDASLIKAVVIAGGVVPMLLLGWDALMGDLGANGVNFAIHTTGMVGLVLLMLSLAVTPLRRITGWQMVIAARRPLGVLSFIYLLLHFGIFFVFDRAASVSSTIEEVLTRTYLQIGTIALFLMAALALTSTDKMVSRLGAKRWKRLHRLTYPISILAVIHFLLLVKSDIRAPRAFAIVLGLFLLYRVVRHYLDLRMKAHAKPRTAASAGPRRFWSGELVVTRIFRETHDVKTFRLALPAGGALPFMHKPGQYLNLALTIGGKRVNRSYTIASNPSIRDYCEISVKRAPDGYASHHLHDHVREGQRLRVSAPAGRFVFAGEGATEVLLIAGGVGITPVMSMLRFLTGVAWPGAIHLVFSVRREEDRIFKDELAYLAERHPNLRITDTLSAPSPQWTGARGRIDRALLATAVPALGGARIPVFLCGPEAMMADTTDLLLRLGVAPDDIATEAFESPPEAAEGTSADATPGFEGDLDTTEGTLEFTRSAVQVSCLPGQTILEAAEEAGIDLPFECRAGICGQCRTRASSGRVVMEVQDGLTASDKRAGFVLACQARPVGPVVVDA